MTGAASYAKFAIRKNSRRLLPVHGKNPRRLLPVHDAHGMIHRPVVSPYRYPLHHLGSD